MVAHNREQDREPEKSEEKIGLYAVNLQRQPGAGNNDNSYDLNLT